jgi:16S rRNA (cytidine1402-2'-O)-methyltransferase
MEIPPKKLLSLHLGNEAKQEDHIVELLRSGQTIGLVSDAGTPAISDPGARLVARCFQEQIAVSIIPGPCAFASAYALSGVIAEKVQFLEFLPKQKNERLLVLKEMLSYDGASVVYESPFRLVETLQMATSLFPDWKVTLVRELTKLHEEVCLSTVDELSLRLQESGVRGECSLVFHPVQKSRPTDEELLQKVQAVRGKFDCTLKEAVDLVAEECWISRRDLYQLVCSHKDL